MRMLVTGATGMVGSGLLQEALADPRVTSVLTLGRRATGRTHPKLEEIVHGDFFDYAAIADRLKGIDACFFCLGVSAAGLSEGEYHRLTYDLAVAAAEAVRTGSPDVTFCYVSGQGTDSSESGRWMWARVKGKLENRLLEMFGEAYMFRPGFIQPLKGVRSRTRAYNALYAVLAPLYPALRRIFPGGVTDSVTLARAMLRVAAEGSEVRVLETRDINRIGAPVG